MSTTPDISENAVLDVLEAEAINVFRETAAAFRNPVLLYSIGKDSSVLLHLAIKAFAPAPIPMPVMHVDTTWKFSEMIAFPAISAPPNSAWTCASPRTPRRSPRGSPRFTHGTHEYTRVMKTVALREGLDE